MNDDPNDWDFTIEGRPDLGSISQLTETEGWGDHTLDEYEEELARKKPLGFAPWPEDTPAD